MTADACKKLVRLYVPTAQPKTEKFCVLSDGQLHYLRNVMRMSAGESLRVFNGRDGEWLADLKEINKKNAIVSFSQKIHEQFPSPDIRILASPVKKEAFDLMVEKSAELGASVFTPVTCDHTVVHRVNEERLQAIAVEAAEQSERLDIMQVSPLKDLKNILNSWDSTVKLIFCIERGGAPPIAQKLASSGLKTPLGVLIGPEGGFSDQEITYIRQFPFVEPVSLGPRILRAETALIAALSCLQAWAGDWRGVSHQFY